MLQESDSAVVQPLSEPLYDLKNLEQLWTSTAFISTKQGHDWRLAARFSIDTKLDQAAAVAQYFGAVRGKVAALLAQKTSSILIDFHAVGSDGYDVSLMIEGDDRFDANFGGLECSFTDLDDAMTWMHRAISGDYRLMIVKAGGYDIEWRLEPVSIVATAGNSLASGHLRLTSLIRARTTRVLRNGHSRVRTTAARA